MNRQQAFDLLCEYTQNENLRRHMLAVEAAMRAYARQFGEDEEKWGLVGLLHDFDYERWPTAPDHPLQGAAVLAARGYPEGPTLSVSAVAMLASVGFLAILAAGEGFFGAFPRFSAGGWAAVVFIGLSSGIGYYLWLWALNHATPTRVTVFLALSPVTAAGLGAALLGERLSIGLLLGLACVALGLWLAYRPDTMPGAKGSETG